MDFVEGRTLVEQLKEKPLPVPVALSVIIIICRALEYAHCQTIEIDGKKYKELVHCDIKPGNILISSDGEVKLSDFGLVVLKDVEKAMQRKSGLTDIEPKGSFPGTVPYMAPEQHTYPEVNVKTDIYALGVTIFELVTGKRPFPEVGEYALIQHVAAKLEGKFKLPTDIDPALPQQINNIVSRCLQPNQRKRYDSYTELRGECEVFLKDYTSVDAEKVVKLYYENKKDYRFSVSDKPKAHLTIPAPVNHFLKGLAAVSLLLTISIAIFYYNFLRNKSLVEFWKYFNEQMKKEISKNNKTTTPSSIKPKDLSQSVQKYHNLDGINYTNRDLTISSKNLNKDKMSFIEAKNVIQPEKIKRSSPFSNAVLAWKEGRFKDAIYSLKSISLDELKALERDSAVIIMLDSYYRIKDINSALLFGADYVVNDAKYFLLMALLYESAELTSEASNYFTKSISAPCKIDPSIATKRYLYRARFLKKKYEESGNKRDYDDMIAAWKDFLEKGCIRFTAECEEAQRIISGSQP
ncbi:MAG: serine/threonine protein kinase, partial [Chitinispirillaceae bacterium]|nr:serine/threonine protein kinase [Chitinispirillaceae bacterium]